MMLQRRKHYPRVKVLGGLYTVRREPKDNSLVREVVRAVKDMPVSKHVSSDEATRWKADKKRVDSRKSGHVPQVTAPPCTQ